MECDLLGLDLAILDINLVTTQHNGDVFTYPAHHPAHDFRKVHEQQVSMATYGAHIPAEISVPCRDVLVCQPRGDIKHDDCALAMDVVTISQATKLFLTSCVPAVEPQLAPVSGEVKRVDFHTNRGCRCQVKVSQKEMSSGRAQDLETG